MQGCALEEALSDSVFIPVSTAISTHLGERQGDTDSTIGLALASTMDEYRDQGLS